MGYEKCLFPVPRYLFPPLNKYVHDSNRLAIFQIKTSPKFLDISVNSAADKLNKV